uniref:Uncharacterized protein n=1 Tax=Pristhesancus plagipennis TaxID=1955184 RepID=A0A2K8JMD0_PRIPG|nr:secreted hypothetical protein [Pristhesancus plagipennis]
MFLSTSLFILILTFHSFISDAAKTSYNKFHKLFSSHSNPLVRLLSSHTLPDNPPRRLKRHCPRDHLSNSGESA